MKTKWMMIPVIALAWGCAREMDTKMSLIEGEFKLYASSVEQGTKTVLQPDGSIFWSPADCINVFYGDKSGKFTSTNDEAAESVEFIGSLGSFTMDGETEFVAVYPYSDATTFSGSSVTVTLPSEQTGVEGTFAEDLFLSVAKSTDVNLYFYNVCGGVKFSVARDDIKKVVFRGNGGESLAGTLEVGFDDKGLPVVADIADDDTAVTLFAPDGGTFVPGTYYYLVLIPQALTLGYTMDLYTDDLAETISSESSVTVRRATWGVLSDLGTASMAVPEAVDLGLSVKWASFNLGASKPEERGEFFAWGETEPKSVYSWETYKWCMGTEDSLTKYCWDSESGYNGFVDDKDELELCDDAAYVKSNGEFRTPSDEEFLELYIECDWTWVTDYNGTGTAGYVISGKKEGYESNSIFLPAAYTVGTGNYGSYMTTSGGPQVVAQGFFTLYFEPDGGPMINGIYNGIWAGRASTGSKEEGYPIRPVFGEHGILVEDVTLDKEAMELSVAESFCLSATVYPENAAIKSVYWHSSDASVASVSSSGVVTGVSAGSATITVTAADGKYRDYCFVTVKESSPSMAVPEAIDLGLPSGLKWASFNLGATAPEEDGDYFAWGETEPYYSSLDPLTWKEGKEAGYDWASYKWSMGSDNTLTKYCQNADYGYNGFTDNKTVLDSEDDAAHVNLGDDWRMPTYAEWTELIDNCTWEWTTQNDVDGLRVTGSNGNSIFLPLAGYVYHTHLYRTGTGACWSSSLYTNLLYRAHEVFFDFDSGYVGMEQDRRYYGRSVRPVYGESSIIPVERVTLDKSELELTAGESTVLNATVLPENATEKTVFWSSSDESVATVSSLGVVTGVASGSAIITATTVDGGKTATCDVTVTASYTVATPEAVDLGLPSGLKWASFNLGATVPEEYGDYFAWGETEPYYSSQDPLTWKEGKETGYDWASYKWCMGANDSMTKYCQYADWGYNGFTDEKTVLDPEDDAAHVSLGGNWRMPTEDEMMELWDLCTWEWTTQNGVNGSLVTGPNGNSVFFPAAGYRLYETDLDNVGSEVDIWSSSLFTDDQDHAFGIFFDADRMGGGGTLREFGYSVRPVTK